jgi:hypothetical protein
VAIKDPFAKKMVRGALAFAAVLLIMFTILTTVYLHLRPKCSDEVVLESMSPDRQWIATAMQRRCGEEEPFLTHVNLRPRDRDIQYGFFSGKAEVGEVFLLERDAQSLHLTLVWNSPSQLTIGCPDCTDVIKRQEHWGDVLIRYEVNRKY